MPGTTVALKPNQGITGNSGVYLFPGSFFVPFWTSKKGHDTNV